jgi:crotonobetainyl-CoA:carnitine CoA-transferase CaiB-like acyl-CoA transferase
MAIHARGTTGRGQEVTTSLLATAVSFQGPILIDQMQLGLNRSPMGNRGFASGPTDLFRTRDGWIVCHVVSNSIFKRWARLIGREDMIDDARFSDDQVRGKNGEHLSQVMQQWSEARTRKEALDELAAASVPAAPILSPQEVIDHPQVEALGLLAPIDYRGDWSRLKVSPVPISMSDTPGSIGNGPPSAGEHTDDILQNLGMSSGEIDKLRAGGVI